MRVITLVPTVHKFGMHPNNKSKKLIIITRTDLYFFMNFSLRHTDNRYSSKHHCITLYLLNNCKVYRN